MKNRRVRVVIALALCMLIVGTAIGFAIVVFLPVKTAQEVPEESTYMVTDNGYSGNSDQDLLAPVLVSEDISEAAQKAQNSVITIETTVVTSYNGMMVQGTASGSGVLFEEDSTKLYFVTNAHVIEDAQAIYAYFSDEEEVAMELVGSDTQADLAVVSVARSDISSDMLAELQVIEWADSDSVRVGDVSIAIGAPQGEEFDSSVTVGVIGGTERQITVNGNTLTVLQTDAAINPGNSGGALVNESGELVGINTAKVSDESIEGMGFAIPSNTVKEVITELKENGSIQRPDLTIASYEFISEEIASVYHMESGILVEELDPTSNAYAAGVRTGDVITAIDNQELTSLEDVTSILNEHKVGDQVVLQITRGRGQEGQNISVQLTLGSTGSDSEQQQDFWGRK